MNTIQPEKLVVYRHNGSWFAKNYYNIGTSKKASVKIKGRGKMFKKLTDMGYRMICAGMEGYTIFTLTNDSDAQQKNTTSSKKSEKGTSPHQPQLL